MAGELVCGVRRSQASRELTRRENASGDRRLCACARRRSLVSVIRDNQETSCTSRSTNDDVRTRTASP